MLTHFPSSCDYFVHFLVLILLLTHPDKWVTEPKELSCQNTEKIYSALTIVPRQSWYLQRLICTWRYKPSGVTGILWASCTFQTAMGWNWNLVAVTFYVLINHVISFSVMFSGSHYVFRFFVRFLVMFFPLSLSFTQVTCFLFCSCTSSPLTSPQYLVSRFSHTHCKILTSLTVHDHASQVFATLFIHSIVHVCSWSCFSQSRLS